MAIEKLILMNIAFMASKYLTIFLIDALLGIRIDETIVTFPDDGVTAMELLSLFSNKIEERYGILIHFQSPQT